MQHIKRRLVGPYTTGFISHVLCQRHGLMEFRRLVRGHRDENRSITAARIWRARREIREEVARWINGLEEDRQHAEKVHEWNRASPKSFRNPE